MADIFVITYETPVYAGPAVARTVYFHWSEASGPPTAELSAPGNPHFIAGHRATSYRQPIQSWDASQSGPVVAPETNVHHVPRHVPIVHRLDARLWQRVADDFSTVPPQPETNVHFLGKYQPTQHYLLRSLWQNVPLDTPLVVQPPTDPHFIGRYQATSYRLDINLRQNIAADFSLVSSFETNVHFIGKFTPTNYILLPALWQNAALDVPATIQPETNPHFIGRFTAAVYTVDIRLRSNVAADFSNPPPQPETNVHFIGPHRPAVYRPLFPDNIRDTTELDGPVQPPDVTKPGGLGVVIHQFTRKRWRELKEELEAARAALIAKAEKSKAGQRKALVKAAAATETVIGILPFLPEDSVVEPAIVSLAAAAEAAARARTRAAVVAQTTAALRYADLILEEAEEEEAEMLLFFH